MKKLTLLLSLMFLAGVGQAAPSFPQGNCSETNGMDVWVVPCHSVTRNMPEVCVHDWKKTDYYLPCPATWKYDKDGRSGYFNAGSSPVEICSKCGLIRIKPERKHE